MKKNTFFLLLLVFVIMFQIIPATGHKKSVSERSAKKHNLKMKRHHEIQRKPYDLKCWPQRCNIICPIQVQPMPSYQNIVTNVPPAVPTPAHASAPPRGTPADTFPIISATPTTGSPIPNRTAPGGIVPQLSNGLNNLNRYLDRGLSILLGNLQHLTKRQKHILTKQYVLGTRNGKKAYKFRQQYAPFGCYVQCEALQQGYPVQQQIPPGALSNGGIEEIPVSGGDDGEDEGNEEEDIDEPYHEGEDRPIEVTASPPDRRQVRLENDLIPGEDFGEQFYFEDKKKRSRSHHRHYNN